MQIPTLPRNARGPDLMTPPPQQEFIRSETPNHHQQHHTSNLTGEQLKLLIFL